MILGPLPSPIRFGDVVSLLSDMISAGLTPNLNTYRVIISACQEAGQVQLAFEVFSLLQLSKIEILKEVSWFSYL